MSSKLKPGDLVKVCHGSSVPEKDEQLYFLVLYLERNNDREDTIGDYFYKGMILYDNDSDVSNRYKKGRILENFSERSEWELVG